MDDQTSPQNLIEVRVCATMAGVRYGDIVYVDADDPDIQVLLNSNPPLLELLDPAAETSAGGGA